ncbi:MAG: hypothetical protein AAF253_10835 [Pseudomonadota bacterium]
MSLKKVLLAGAAMLAATAAPANASIVDNPHFKVLGLVIVWGDGNIASDFVIDTAAGAGDADLIAGDVTPVVTGSLAGAPGANEGALLSISNAVSGGVLTDAGTVGVLDAADSFTAFEVDGSTDVGFTGAYTSQWFAASNTPFNVTADVTGVTPTEADAVEYGLAVTAPAASTAAFAVTAADVQVAAGDTLDDIDGIDVFEGSTRTAEDPGTLLEQAWQFENTYSLDYDLSQGVIDIAPTVTFTVYVP